MNELKLETCRTAIVVIDLQKRIAAMAAGAPHPTPKRGGKPRKSPNGRAGAHPVLVHVIDSIQGAYLLPMRCTRHRLGDRERVRNRDFIALL